MLHELELESAHQLSDAQFTLRGPFRMLDIASIRQAIDSPIPPTHVILVIHWLRL